MKGNFGFASDLLDTLKKYENTCPVMLSSSIQATLIGRYGTSDYGKSKLAGEELFFAYGMETGAKVLVYRFPNLFGKWCRPNYNSAGATFCNNMANDLPIQVNDPSTELELLYIDDLVEELTQVGRIAPRRNALLLAIVLQEFVGVLVEIDREKAIEKIGRSVDDARSFLALEQQLLVLTTSLHGKHHDHHDRCKEHASYQDEA